MEIKSKQQPEKRIDELTITDEDLVPLELFDVVLGQIKHKFDDKRQLCLDLVSEAKLEISKKVKAMEMEKNEK